jgi:16S rRNA (guanine527-N7)-methyltransferase
MLNVRQLASVDEPLTPQEFAAISGVSRETLERMKLYVDLLLKWQKSVRLIGPSTINDLWRRHILDSTQLLTIVPPKACNLVDFGSGAGLPGFVLAILGVPDVHLVESNIRKCAFLRAAATLTNTTVTIHNTRIENLTNLSADTITARTLGPLDDLLNLSEPYLIPSTVCIFSKGQGVKQELTRVTKNWNMEIECIQSKTHATGTIVRMEKIDRANQPTD